jgi:hypothetical protein
VKNVRGSYFIGYNLAFDPVIATSFVTSGLHGMPIALFVAVNM